MLPCFVIPILFISAQNFWMTNVSIKSNLGLNFNIFETIKRPYHRARKVVICAVDEFVVSPVSYFKL